MGKSEFKYNSSIKLTRAERRAFERKFKNAESKAKTIDSNASFNKAKTELIKLGWIYEESFGNMVDFGDETLITHSPIIMLVNQIFNVKLIPNGNGIEISRLEVRAKFQERGFGGYFLINLLRFLTKLGIDEIYVLPIPLAFDKSSDSLADNQEELEQFFIKRGFLKQEESRYWKLDSKLFQERYGNSEIHLEFLNQSSHILHDEDFKIFFKVYFEFEGDNHKKFVWRYKYTDYNKILNNLNEFHNSLPDSLPEMPDLKNILSKTCKSEVINEKEIEVIMEYFEGLLFECSEETDYKTLLHGLGGVLAGFLFINLNCDENGINAFRFAFKKIGN